MVWWHDCVGSNLLPCSLFVEAAWVRNTSVFSLYKRKTPLFFARVVFQYTLKDTLWRKLTNLHTNLDFSKHLGMNLPFGWLPAAQSHKRTSPWVKNQEPSEVERRNKSRKLPNSAIHYILAITLSICLVTVASIHSQVLFMPIASEGRWTGKYSKLCFSLIKVNRLLYI